MLLLLLWWGLINGQLRDSTIVQVVGSAYARPALAVTFTQAIALVATTQASLELQKEAGLHLESKWSGIEYECRPQVGGGAAGVSVICVDTKKKSRKRSRAIQHEFSLPKKLCQAHNHNNKFPKNPFESLE